MPSRLICLNIEGSRHLDRIFPFLQTQTPDYLCLQEVREEDLAAFEQKTGMRSIFAPYHHLLAKPGSIAGRQGIAILSRQDPSESETVCYGNFHEDSWPETQHCLFLRASFADGLTLITTHFTWSANGQPTQAQRQNLERLLFNLERYPRYLLCGDFNAPRGGEIFAALAQNHLDHIPTSVSSTLDPVLHRAGPLPYVVDGLFSKGEHLVSNVEVRDGLSDHCAILASLGQ